MAQELTLKCAGLVTDPNPVNEIPHGSLRQAQNVVIRRMGCAQPRPGFESFNPETVTADAVVEAIFPSDETFSYFLSGEGVEGSYKAWKDEDGAYISPYPGYTLSPSYSTASEFIFITGDAAIRAAFPFVVGDVVTDADVGFLEGGTHIAANTRIVAVTVLPSLIQVEVAPDVVLGGSAPLRFWPVTVEAGLIDGTVTAPATVLTTTGLRVDPTQMQFLTDSGELPSADSTNFSAMTRITYIDVSEPDPDETGISKPTLANLNADPIDQWIVGEPSVIGHVDAVPEFAYTIGETFAAEMQRRQYVTLTDGLARLEEASNTYYSAGMSQPGQAVPDLVQSEADGWLGLGDMVAYRIVLARKIGQQLLLSAPSAPSFISPTNGYLSPIDLDSSFYVTLQGNLPPDVAVGDVVQIYRTETAVASNNPSTPGDEMRLLGTVPVTALEMALRKWTYSDLSPDTQLTGAALYTNATQQGILAANVKPPRFGTICTYQDMLFGGNVSQGHTLELSMVGSPISGEFEYTDPTRLWPALRLASESFIVTIVATQDTILIVGDVSTLSFKLGDYVAGVGESIFNGGTVYPRDTYITAIDLTTPGEITLTVSEDALLTVDAFDHIVATKFLNDLQTVASVPDEATGLIVSTFSGAIGSPSSNPWFVSNDGTRPTQPSVTGIDDATQVTGVFPVSGSPNVYAIHLSRPLNSAVASGTPIDAYFIDWQNPTSIGLSDATVIDINIGSPVIDITGTGARYAFVPGQEITDYDKAPGDTGTVFPAGTEVLSVELLSPTHVQITVTNNALADAGAFAAWDWIAINDVRFYGATYADWDPLRDRPNIYLYDQSFLWSLQGIGGRHAYLNTDGVNLQALGSGTSPRALLFDYPYFPGAEVSVTTSKPNAFAEEIGPDTPMVSTSETHPNRLMWSKTQEPDAWPVPYFADIGSASAPIQAILPTRDSLFVFKRDGTWRVTGFSPESLRIDEYDRTLKLMHPMAVSRLANQLVGWFVSGVCAVTDSATQNISENLISREMAAIKSAPAPEPYVSNVWAFSVERDGEWVLITGTDQDEHGNVAYVFNTTTSAWVKWAIDAEGYLACGADLEQRSKMILGGTHVNTTPESLLWIETADSFDGPSEEVNILTSTFVRAYRDSEAWSVYNVTFESNTLPPKVGDVFDDDSNIFYVIEVISDTEVLIVCEADSPPSAPGIVEHRYSAAVAVEWTAKTAQNPGKRKHWREANFAFEGFQGVVTPELGFSGNVADYYEPAAASAPVDRIGTGEDKPYFLRSLIPREARRQVWLNPMIRLTGGFGRWHLDACDLVYEWMETRT